MSAEKLKYKKDQLLKYNQQFKKQFLLNTTVLKAVAYIHFIDPPKLFVPFWEEKK